MQATPQIIAICGYKGSGKDTAAAYIATHYHYQHRKFAAPLKKAVEALFGFTAEEMTGSYKEMQHPFWGISPRHAMQKLGTEVFQDKLKLLLNEIPRYGFWAKRLLKSYQGEKLVISDLRFVHEYEALKAVDPHLLVFRIERALPEVDSHASEKEFRNIPHQHSLLNLTDKATLYKNIDKVLQNYSKAS